MNSGPLGHHKNRTAQVRAPLSGARPVQAPSSRSIHPFLSEKVGIYTHGQEISQPRDDHRKVNQRPETIPKTDKHNRDHRLKQHRVQGGLEPGVKLSKEGREMAFLSGGVDEPSSREEGS